MDEPQDLPSIFGADWEPRKPWEPKVAMLLHVIPAAVLVIPVLGVAVYQNHLPAKVLLMMCLPPLMLFKGWPTLKATVLWVALYLLVSCGLTLWMIAHHYGIAGCLIYGPLMGLAVANATVRKKPWSTS